MKQHTHSLSLSLSRTHTHTHTHTHTRHTQDTLSHPSQPPPRLFLLAGRLLVLVITRWPARRLPRRRPPDSHAEGAGSALRRGGHWLVSLAAPRRGAPGALDTGVQRGGCGTGSRGGGRGKRGSGAACSAGGSGGAPAESLLLAAATKGLRPSGRICVGQGAAGEALVI
jgi:hypothetical protein